MTAASEARRLAAWCRAKEARGESISMARAEGGGVVYAGRSRGGRWDRYRCPDGSTLEVSTRPDARGRRTFRAGRGARRAEARQ